MCYVTNLHTLHAECCNISFITGYSFRFGSRQTKPVGSRERVSLPDGTTTVFDLYLDPIRKDPLLENVMIVVLPGIMNHSGSDYILSYIEYASSQGFKVACYNHYGESFII